MTEGEWAFAAPSLALIREDADQRVHDLREVFNAVRWAVTAGSPWRLLPHDPRAAAPSRPPRRARGRPGGRRTAEVLAGWRRVAFTGLLLTPVLELADPGS